MLDPRSSKNLSIIAADICSSAADMLICKRNAILFSITREVFAEEIGYSYQEIISLLVINFSERYLLQCHIAMSTLYFNMFSQCALVYLAQLANLKNHSISYRVTSQLVYSIAYLYITENFQYTHSQQDFKILSFSFLRVT